MTIDSDENNGVDNWNTQMDRLDSELETFKPKEVLYKDNDPTLPVLSQEVDDSIALPASSQEAPKSKRKNANTATKNRAATKKRKRRENKRAKQDQKKENIELKNHQESCNANTKQEESEDCIDIVDIETVSGEIPGIYQLVYTCVYNF